VSNGTSEQNRLFSDREDYGRSKFQFLLKFTPTSGVLGPNLAFLHENFSRRRKFLGNFPTGQLRLLPFPATMSLPPRTSTSHLATDPGSRPSAAQPRTELSVETRPRNSSW